MSKCDQSNKNHRLLANEVVTLRAIEPDDIDILLRWDNDTSMWDSGSLLAPLSRKRLWDYVENYNPDIYTAGGLRLIAEETTSGKPVGMIELYDFDPHNRRCGVGIMVDPERHGCGIGRNILALTVDYISRFIGLHQLWAIVAIDNVASISLFKDEGFEICGRLRSWLRRGGSYIDCYQFQHLFNI